MRQWRKKTRKIEQMSNRFTKFALNIYINTNKYNKLKNL